MLPSLPSVPLSVLSADPLGLCCCPLLSPRRQNKRSHSGGEDVPTARSTNEPAVSPAANQQLGLLKKPGWVRDEMSSTKSSSRTIISRSRVRTTCLRQVRCTIWVQQRECVVRAEGRVRRSVWTQSCESAELQTGSEPDQQT